MKKIIRKLSIVLAFIMIISAVPFAGVSAKTRSTSADTTSTKSSEKRHSYGVFIGADKLNYKKMGYYDTVVIDAEYFSKKQIAKLKKAGCKRVYSYLDVGSLEDFRDYFKDFEDLILSEYDNWPGEYWVDVSDEGWQQLCVSRAKQFRKKGVDGFFIDNCDVYYQYPQENIYEGLTAIMSGIKATEGKVIINGGDRFVRRLIKDKNTGIIDGVNQESVYTAIDFKHNKFIKAKPDDRRYFTSYLKKVKGAKKKVYVLEYATSPKLKKAARKYARKNGWTVYVSPSLKLR